jgi:hypothetical protein
MAKTIKWLAAGLLLAVQAAGAETVTLPSGETVAVVKPTLSTTEMDLRLQKAIDALAANKAQDEKTAPSPGTVASPPVLTGYSLYPR